MCFYDSKSVFISTHSREIQRYVSSCWLCLVHSQKTSDFFFFFTTHSYKSSERASLVLLTHRLIHPVLLTLLYLTQSPPHSHLHRSQHSLRLCIYFKPTASLHNGRQVPPAGTVCCEHSTRIGLNFKRVSCLWVDLAQKAQWSHSSLQ